CASNPTPPSAPTAPAPVSAAPPASTTTASTTSESAPGASASAPSSAKGAIDIPASIRAAVDAADRSAKDKELDAGRHPAQTLAFFGIAPGMEVAEIAAASGYTTELLARAVGPSGTVYGVNSKWILEKFAEKPWSERL